MSEIGQMLEGAMRFPLNVLLGVKGFVSEKTWKEPQQINQDLSVDKGVQGNRNLMFVCVKPVRVSALS